MQIKIFALLISGLCASFSAHADTCSYDASFRKWTKGVIEKTKIDDLSELYASKHRERIQFLESLTPYTSEEELIDGMGRPPDRAVDAGADNEIGGLTWDDRTETERYSFSFSIAWGCLNSISITKSMPPFTFNTIALYSVVADYK